MKTLPYTVNLTLTIEQATKLAHCMFTAWGKSEGKAPSVAGFQDADLQLIYNTLISLPKAEKS